MSCCWQSIVFDRTFFEAVQTCLALLFGGILSVKSCRDPLCVALRKADLTVTHLSSLLEVFIVLLLLLLLLLTQLLPSCREENTC